MLQTITDGPRFAKLEGITVPQHVFKDLKPNTNYSFTFQLTDNSEMLGSPFTVWAKTDYEAPPKPSRPPLISMNGVGGEVSLVIARLFNFSEANGPISEYMVFVGDVSSGLIEPSVYTAEDPSPSVWVAGNFSRNSLPTDLVIGDGRVYGSFMNRRLERQKQYRLFLRAITQPGYSKQRYEQSTDWSKIFTTDGVIAGSIAGTPVTNELIAKLPWILGPGIAAIIILIILVLILCFIRYVYWPLQIFTGSV